jgi:nucleotide-binding universal stress UspA family protein
MGYQNIVVAFDGSASSQQALERAVGLARGEALLTILGIEEPWPAHRRADPGAEHNGHLRAMVQAGVDRAHAAGVRARGEIRAGYPADVLVRLSEEQGYDLVILGAGDRGGAALGPTADKVAHLVRCAVLVVR